MISSIITAAGREMIERAAAKRARNHHYSRAKQGFPALRSSRVSGDARRCTWTADSPPLGELLIDGEPVAEVTGFSCVREPMHGITHVLDPYLESVTNAEYGDLASLYPETTKRMSNGPKKHWDSE